MINNNLMTTRHCAQVCWWSWGSTCQHLHSNMLWTSSVLPCGWCLRCTGVALPWDSRVDLLITCRCTVWITCLIDIVSTPST